MDRKINALGHENNVVYEFNATEKIYLKEQIELIGKLTHQKLECFPVLQKTSQLNFQINVYK